MGGSGGFYAGIKRAMEQAADWIWVSDDDAYLKDDALKQASDYLEEQPDLQGTHYHKERYQFISK